MRVGLYISTHFIFNCILNFAINLLTKLELEVQAPVDKFRTPAVFLSASFTTAMEPRLAATSIEKSKN
jgi:hypothetical protein